MFLKKNWKGGLLSALVVVVLLSLPVAAGAQTTAPMTNGITNPKDMAALSGTVEVKGYANSPDFMKWQLDLLPNGDSNAAVFLAYGEEAGEFTYSLDTSMLPAGEHALRLRVVRNDSNYEEYMTKFTIGDVAPRAAAAPAATPAAATSPAPATTPVATTTAATPGVGVTTNGFAAPTEGQTISGDFVVRGYADSPDFMKWQLDLLPNGNADQAVFLDLGETAGVFTYTLDAMNLPAGEHELRLRVVRNDSNYDEYMAKFMIGAAAPAATAPAATAPMTDTMTSTATAPMTDTMTATAPAGQMMNGITMPKEGASVTGQVEIKGYADSPNFMKWQLDLLPGGNADQAAFLAYGEKAGEFTYTLDTTMLPAGEHALRLRVVREDSNYDEYVTKFTITK